MPLKIIYEDDTLLVVDKLAGIDIEGIKKLLGENGFPAHRLDKDTSGLLLVAKTKDALEFLQKQFRERKVEKKYVCLVAGNIKNEKGRAETFLARAPGDRRKQRVFLGNDPSGGAKREAVTEYRVLKRYDGYTLLEATPKTGRKHQIRVHMAHLNHPIARDQLYGFKNQKIPDGLQRQFLHASYLKFRGPDGSTKEFTSDLPEDLQIVLKNLHENN